MRALPSLVLAAAAAAALVGAATRHLPAGPPPLRAHGGEACADAAPERPPSLHETPGRATAGDPAPAMAAAEPPAPRPHTAGPEPRRSTPARPLAELGAILAEPVVDRARWERAVRVLANRVTAADLPALRDAASRAPLPEALAAAALLRRWSARSEVPVDLPPPAVAALRGAWAGDDRAAAGAAARSLVRFGGPGDLRAVVAELSSPEPARRSLALHALGELGAEVADEIVAQLAATADPDSASALLAALRPALERTDSLGPTTHAHASATVSALLEATPESAAVEARAAAVLRTLDGEESPYSTFNSGVKYR